MTRRLALEIFPPAARRPPTPPARLGQAQPRQRQHPAPAAGARSAPHRVVPEQRLGCAVAPAYSQAADVCAAHTPSSPAALQAPAAGATHDTARPRTCPTAARRTLIAPCQARTRPPGPLPGPHAAAFVTCPPEQSPCHAELRTHLNTCSVPHPLESRPLCRPRPLRPLAQASATQLCRRQSIAHFARCGSCCSRHTLPHTGRHAPRAACAAHSLPPRPGPAPAPAARAASAAEAGLHLYYDPLVAS